MVQGDGLPAQGVHVGLLNGGIPDHALGPGAAVEGGEGQLAAQHVEQVPFAESHLGLGGDFHRLGEIAVGQSGVVPGPHRQLGFLHPDHLSPLLVVGGHGAGAVFPVGAAVGHIDVVFIDIQAGVQDLVDRSGFQGGHRAHPIDVQEEFPGLSVGGFYQRQPVAVLQVVQGGRAVVDPHHVIGPLLMGVGIHREGGFGALELRHRVHALPGLSVVKGLGVLHTAVFIPGIVHAQAAVAALG